MSLPSYKSASMRPAAIITCPTSLHKPRKTSRLLTHLSMHVHVLRNTSTMLSTDRNQDFSQSRLLPLLFLMLNIHHKYSLIHIIRRGLYGKKRPCSAFSSQSLSNQILGGCGAQCRLTLVHRRIKTNPSRSSALFATLQAPHLSHKKITHYTCFDHTSLHTTASHLRGELHHRPDRKTPFFPLLTRYGIRTATFPPISSIIFSMFYLVNTAGRLLSQTLPGQAHLKSVTSVKALSLTITLI